MKLILILSALVLSLPLFAQPELSSNEFKGYILTKKGKEEGIIKRNGNEYMPWDHQTKVSFMPMKKYEKAKKLKNKYYDKYKAKDLVGYGYEDKEYKTMKVTDFSVVNLPRKFFLLVEAEGTADLYRFYEMPPAVSSTLDADINRIRNNPHFFIYTEEMEKMKHVKDVDLLAFLEGCPEVKEAYENGDYGVKPVDKDENSGLKGFITKQMDNNRIGASMVPVIRDYNECQAGQAAK